MNEQDLYMTTARDAAFEGWEKGEPMYWRDVGPNEIWEASWKAAMKSAELRNLYRARPSDTSPAQPADHADELTIAYMSGVHTGKKMKREWAGLTADEMLEALISVDPATKRLPIGFARFAQVIEAKLKEKNGGAA